MLFTFIVASLLVSCKDGEDSIIDNTASSGGGIVFYDAGDWSNGWRYLEAAPLDLDGKYTYPEAIAKCEEYSTVVDGNVYDDWRLPNAYELNLMYVNLAKEGKGSFKDLEYYWSSDESTSNPGEAQAIKFKIDYEAATLSKLPKEGKEESKCYVRPIRAY